MKDQFLDDPRRGRKSRLPRPNVQPLDSREVDGLHQFDKPSLGGRQGRFGVRWFIRHSISEKSEGVPDARLHLSIAVPCAFSSGCPGNCPLPNKALQTS